MLKTVYKALIDYLMPHRCLACAKITHIPLALCAECWKDYHFLNEPWCVTCGRPHNLPLDFASNCLRCLHSQPPFTIARGLLKYDNQARNLIHAFKYYDKTILAEFFAKMLFARYQDLLIDIDLIIPVPMHRLKRLLRWYNQAYLLAHELHKLTNIPLAVTALKKVKFTRSQTFLTRKARQTNLKSSIKVIDPELIKAKKILLIDDVITTGSTINYTAKLLKAAGAKEIKVLCIGMT